MHLKLRHRLNGAIVITFLIIALLFTLIQVPFRKHQLERSIENIEMLLQTLVERDTEQLANEIFDSRIQAISIRIDGMRKVEGILGIGIVDHSGKVFATGGEGFIDQELDQTLREKVQKQAQLEKVKWQGQEGILYSKDISFLGEQLGFIRIHYSLERVERDQWVSLLIFSFLLFTTLVTMLVLLNLILSKSILHPIMHLRDATQYIADGDLEKDIVMQRNDELGNLADSFRKMRDAIKEQISRMSIEVEERKLAEHNLKITLDSIGDGVISTDINGKITQINPIAEHLTAWQAKEAKGKSLNEVFRIVGKDTGEDTEDFIEKFMVTGEMEVVADRTMLISRKGHQYRIFHSGAPIRSEVGDTLGVVLVFRDITEEHALQERLRQSQKMEAIGLLAGGVAHDLNNILSGLVSYPDMLLLNRSPEDPMTQPLKTIRKSGKRAASIVQDLLTLSRQSARNMVPLNLNSIVRDFLESPERSDLDKNFKGIEYQLELDKELLNIRGSEAHLSKILMNLYTNAFEAMPEGGILTIGTQNCFLATEKAGYEAIPAGEYSVLRLKDTGVGFSDMEIGHLFEPFYTTKVMGKSGTGLGMSVVWGALKDHNGHIDVISHPKNGAEFVLYFPVTRESIPEVDKAGIEDYIGGGEEILVIDDMPEQRRFATEILELLGYQVQTASSGEEAITLCEQKNYDLLLLDMIMPEGIDGLETYYRIKVLNPGQKALVASGFSESINVREAQRIGAGSYLRKPYTVKSLAKAVLLELSPQKTVIETKLK